MSSAETLDSARLSFGYLLPTREAIMFDRPAAAPLLELGERAEQLGFDAIGPATARWQDLATMPW